MINKARSANDIYGVVTKILSACCKTKFVDTREVKVIGKVLRGPLGITPMSLRGASRSIGRAETTHEVRPTGAKLEAKREPSDVAPRL
jgi:hypothetical protein